MSEVLIPSEEIQDWQAIRKSQWGLAKNTLKTLGMKTDDLKKIKPMYVEGFQSDPGKIFDFFPEPIIQFWLYADQSTDAWDQIWDEYRSVKQDFMGERDTFLRVAHNGEREFLKYDLSPIVKSYKQTYGAFGGLEQQMLHYFIPSEVYTDDEMEVGGKVVRKVPWATANETFLMLLLNMLNPFKLNIGENREYKLDRCSPFTPTQWMHPMLVSTFSYDIEATFNENAEYLATIFLILKSILDDSLHDRFHPNHIASGLNLIEIFEDEGSPSYLRNLWLSVRDGRYHFKPTDIHEWSV